MRFERVFSGAPRERQVGYCRALKAGERVFVTGTAPVEEGGGVQGIGILRRLVDEVLAQRQRRVMRAEAPELLHQHQLVANGLQSRLLP
jgi:hypothetical protein